MCAWTKRTTLADSTVQKADAVDRDRKKGTVPSSPLFLNFVYMQSEINIKIGNKAPSQYFAELRDQCAGGKKRYGAITGLAEMQTNLDVNCIPPQMLEGGAIPYDEFLQERRRLIASKIRAYYAKL